MLTPVLLALVLAASTATLVGVRTAPGLDFYPVWVGGRVLPEMPPGRVYSVEARARTSREAARLTHEGKAPDLGRVSAYWEERWSLMASPLMLALYARLSPDRYLPALQLHRAVSLAASLLAVVVACRCLAFSVPETLALLVLLVAAFAPVDSDLTVGNVSQLQLGTLGLLLALRTARPSLRVDLAGGALLGLAVAFKPTLAVVAGVLGLAWAVDGRWRTLGRHAAGALAGAGLGIGFAAWHFGSLAVWRAWLPMLALRVQDLDLRVSEGNLAPAALVAEATGVGVAPLVTAALVLGTGIALWRSRTPGGEPGAAGLLREQRALGLGCAVLLLGAPLVWLHYHVLAALPFLVALRPPGASPGAAWPALAALAPLVALDVLGGVPEGRMAVLAVAAGCGVLVLYLLLLRQLGAPAPAPVRRKGPAGRRR